MSEIRNTRFQTLAELHEFCNEHGFALDYDNQGQIILYTGYLVCDDQESLRDQTNSDLE